MNTKEPARQEPGWGNLIRSGCVNLKEQQDNQVGSFALLFATLIGVFITPDGIVVGADSAVSSRRGQSTREKYCVTGPHGVSTLQGVYELTDTETNATVALYDEFREWCARIDRTQLPATLRGQAQFIAEALRTALDRFLEDVPAIEVLRQYSSNPVVARIAV